MTKPAQTAGAVYKALIEALEADNGCRFIPPMHFVQMAFEQIQIALNEGIVFTEDMVWSLCAGEQFDDALPEGVPNTQVMLNLSRTLGAIFNGPAI